MIRHIVAWTLAADTPDQRAADIQGLREHLEPLTALPGVQSIVVRGDIGVDGNWDALLVGDYDSVEALDAYRVHPEHLAAVEYVRSVTTDRVSVDIEL